MGLVKLDDLAPGMVLAQHVLDRKGNLIVKQGVVLAQNHIEFLRKWNVPAVDIVGVNEKSMEEMKAEIASNPEVQAELAQIEARFAGVQDDLLLLIRDTVVRRYLAKAARG